MMPIQYEIKPFLQLTVSELYNLLKLRVDVFVVEQNCAYPELDGKDIHPEALHLMGKTSDDHIIACLRIMPPGLHGKEVSMGRVAVAKDCRRTGICDTMVRKALDQVRSVWPGQDIRVSAQVYLEAFYGLHGFQTVSGHYLEDGIPHVDMIRKYSV